MSAQPVVPEASRYKDSADVFYLGDSSLPSESLSSQAWRFACERSRRVVTVGFCLSRLISVGLRRKYTFCAGSEPHPVVLICFDLVVTVHAHIGERGLRVAELR